MSLSRRKFITAGVVAAACATLPLKSALGHKAQSPPTSSSVIDPEQLGYYTQSSFAPYVNTQFSVHLDTSNTRRLKLVEVSDYLSTLPRSVTRGSLHKTECFSLLLTTPAGRAFQQDTYLIEHGALGAFYLFMVPVSQAGKTALDYYEAIIYRQLGNQPGQNYTFNNGPPRGKNPQAATAATAGFPQGSDDGRKTREEVFYFRPKELEPPASSAPATDPGAAGRIAASRMTVAQAPEINGLKLGMAFDQVLALFPGIREDAEVRPSLSRAANAFGVRTLVIRPERYLTANRFDRVSQIVLTFLDGRISAMNVGYNGPSWQHVDEFVAKFAEETRLPGADSWKAYAGMEAKLKTLKGMDFEVSVFAGGENVDMNYVQMRDTGAQQKLKERKKARMTTGAKS